MSDTRRRIEQLERTFGLYPPTELDQQLAYLRTLSDDELEAWAVGVGVWCCNDRGGCTCERDANAMLQSVEPTADVLDAPDSWLEQRDRLAVDLCTLRHDEATL